MRPALHNPNIKPENISDDAINANNCPVWSWATLMYNIKQFSRDPLYDNGVIGSIVLNGFAHIDADVGSAGTNAQRICDEAKDYEYLRRKTGQHNHAAFCPVTEDFKGQGPFSIVLSTEANELVFKVTGEGQSEEEANRLGIPIASIRTRGRSYMEFMEENSDGDKHPVHKKIFDAERKNNHRSHAIFIAEKLAQQGWCVGEGVANLLFELSLYLIVPERKIHHEAKLVGGQTAGDGSKFGGLNS